ncbi:MAG: transcription-repair coupling factor [SAR324 cluster bacterium]|nr:transcription-repair coupling factor [SAR324 cluster bacterium]
MKHNTLPLLTSIAQSQQKFGIRGLRTSSKALIFSALQRLCKTPVIIVCESYEKAEALKEDLEFFMGEEGIEFLPHWDTLPYDTFSPQKDIIAKRVITLGKLLKRDVRCVLTTPNSLMQRTMPRSLFRKACFYLKQGDVYQREMLIAHLKCTGYSVVDVVEEPGEFSDHGNVLDLFPVNMNQAVRCRWNNDVLEQLSCFETSSQQSTSLELEDLEILPASELLFFPEITESIPTGLLKYRDSVDQELFQQRFELLRQNKTFPGIESLLGVFYRTFPFETPIDYFPGDARILFDEENRILDRAQFVFEEVFSEYELSRSQGNLAPIPEAMYLSHQDLSRLLHQFNGTIDGSELGVQHHTPSLIEFPFAGNTELRQTTRKQSHDQVVQMINKVRSWIDQNIPVCFTARTHTSAEHFKELLADFSIDATVCRANLLPEQMDWPKLLDNPQQPLPFAPPLILTGKLSAGFRWLDDEGHTLLAVLTEEEIFGEKVRNRRLQTQKPHSFAGSLDDLREGDHVVHWEYGIGRYEGLKKITAGGVDENFMVIVYAQSGKVYVPVSKFHLIQKYINADGSRPSLNKLGDKAWKKARSNATKAAEDIAHELIEIYATRKARQGFAFSRDDHLMQEFDLSFPFEETPDQESAIESVKQDMESTTPMDRLICGDVGFGKTEVAIRAAVKAANDGKQVAILVPTTILAQQHFSSFSKRLESMPFTVDVLSRFRSPSEQKQTLKQLSEGKVDILIGTHRLLSEDVKFKDLGLLVIDEEQRFGVKHKEKIKRFRSQIDILTLSATPIPRTLHMSMMGIRDLSVITTPPVDRLAVRTRFLKTSDHIIQDAISRELRRNGQVFIVHNRVETIYEYTTYLRSILPNVRMAVAHGQMGERQLEQVMLDFMSGQYDVLVTTTIIESGLDIPRANTILINNADHFGLAQLYQLRGRVGRSNIQAYAYLLVPTDKVLNNVAQERLKILQELNDLGAGFKVASRDLELRGAGDVLGSSQSGHITNVGLELFTQTIDQAVRKLQKRENDLSTFQEIKLDLGVDISIPRDYIRSTSQQLSLYKRLAQINVEEHLWQLQHEIEDRYGMMPETVINLFKSAHIQFWGKRFGMKSIEYKATGLRIQWAATDKLNPQELLAWMSEPGSPVRLTGENIVELRGVESDMDSILKGLQTFQRLFRQTSAVA